MVVFGFRDGKVLRSKSFILLRPPDRAIPELAAPPVMLLQLDNPCPAVPGGIFDRLIGKVDSDAAYLRSEVEVAFEQRMSGDWGERAPARNLSRLTFDLADGRMSALREGERRVFPSYITDCHTAGLRVKVNLNRVLLGCGAMYAS